MCFFFYLARDKGNITFNQSQTQRKVWPRAIKQVGSSEGWDFCVALTTLPTSLDCSSKTLFQRFNVQISVASNHQLGSKTVPLFQVIKYYLCQNGDHYGGLATV